MRINKIRFCNINSLKRKHEISFETEPLYSAGLYAITGPTGSGKSTILDVITLALYNQVPRLGKISRSTIEKMGSIVTHFTEEAWAEVEYTNKNKNYRSRWSISTARTGNYRDYEMDIVELPVEKSLGILKGEIPSENEKLIGLSYDQFMKSILLSQGDFSKFLQAKKEDRAKLLEEITGTSIYRELGKLAFEKTKDKKAQVDTIKARLQMISLLSDDEILSRKNLIETLSNQLKINNQLLKNLFQLIQIQLSHQKMEEKKQTIEEKKAIYIQLNKDFEPDKILLQQHEEAKEYEPIISSLLQEQKTVKEIELELSNNQTELNNAVISKKVILQKMESFIDKEITEDTFYEEMAQFEKEITAFDSQLNEIKNIGIELRNRINQLIQKNTSPINHQLTEKINAEEAIRLIQKRKEAFIVDDKDNADLLRQEWENIQLKKVTISDYDKYYYESESSRNAIDEHQKLLAHFEQELLDFNNQLIQLNEIETREEKVLLNLKNKLDEALLEATLDDHRANLEDGKPCPLCGSLHHPYKEDQLLSDIGKLTIEIKKLEEQLSKIDIEQKQIHKNITTVELKRNQEKSTIDIFKSKLLESNDQLKSLRKSYSWLNQIADEKWKEEIEKLNHEQLAIQKKLSEIEEKRYLLDLDQEFHKLSQSLQNYNTIHLKRQERYKGSEVHKEADKIQNEFTSITSKITSLHENTNKLMNQKKEVQLSFDRHFQELHPLLENYKFEYVEQAANLLLTNNEYKLILSKKDNLSSRKTEIETMERTLREDVEALNLQVSKLSESDRVLFNQSSEQLTKTSNELQESIKKTNQQIGAAQSELEANSKNKMQFKELEEALKETEKNNANWILLNDLIGDSQGKKFSNYAQDLTLVHLLIRANARLEGLTDRYLLSFTPDDDDLQVIDKYQGDTVRAVKTLSGGETFLLSLALALSLSDFASKSVRLESLFIDEGFGTLDQETLDMAMSTLEKLQTEGGKKIGIISHVESLKERINTQIRVHKDAQGYSTLEVSN